MSQLVQLMTKRARAQHALDLLHTRGRAADDRTTSAHALLAHVSGLTTQINILLARKRKAARDSASASARDRAAKGNDGTRRQSVTGTPRGSDSKEDGPRSRARALRRTAKARFGAHAARACTMCRMADRDASGEWSTVREESWPPMGGIAWNCRDFDTLPGDELDISVSISAGPAPPGPTRMSVSISVDGNRVFSELLESGTYPIPFTSPGGVVRVCAYNGWPGEPPHNWDFDDSGNVTVRHRRKKPNLVPQGPHIWWDERWVGFGYRVENNQIYRGDPKAGLYYAKKGEGGAGVVLGALRERSTSRQLGAQENWDTNTNDYRVSFDAMGLPPEEATHMVSVVDLERAIDELRENDNINWHDLPQWGCTLEWLDLSLQTAPTSVLLASKGSKSSRLVKVYELRLQAKQEIWKRLVPAQERCSLRVYVDPSGRPGSDPPRGWVFPSWYSGKLKGSRINIPDAQKIHEKHPPVNELRELSTPLGAKNSQSKYLFIPCTKLNRSDGTFSILYIPPCVAGTDRIRVELWDDVLNKPVQFNNSPDNAIITRSIQTTKVFTLSWTQAPRPAVRASVLLKSTRDVALQQNRYCEPFLVKARATLNGRPLGKDYLVRVSVQPWRERTRGSGAFVKDTQSPRSWVFPERYEKRLQTVPFNLKRSKSNKTPALIEPGAPDDVRGVRRAAQPYLDVPLNDRGGMGVWVVPPGISGEDEIVLQLIKSSKATPKKPPIDATLKSRTRILRHKVPTIFVPGIMGSRISIRYDNDVYHWAPDMELEMVRWIARGVDTSRLVLHHQNATSVLSTVDESSSDVPTSEECTRGYAGLFFGYTLAVRSFESTRFDLEPFDRIVHAVGYDFRRSNRQSGNMLEGMIRQICESEKDALGNAAQFFTLISHSMGGLVSRSMLLDFPSTAARCLAAIHGFQPVTGAIAAYRRMFTGYTLESDTWPDRVLRQIVGSDGRKYTSITSGVQSGFELFPTNFYPTAWIDVTGTYAGNNPPTTLPPETATVLYRSAYGIDSWRGDDSTDAELLRRELGARLDATEAFHDRLRLYQLPDRTWAVFGSGLETDTSVQLTVDSQSGSVYALPRRTLEGDGTVPAVSGSALFPNQLANSATSSPNDQIRQVRVDGVPHQDGWNSEQARRFASEAIRWSLSGRTTADL